MAHGKQIQNDYSMNEYSQMDAIYGHDEAIYNMNDSIPAILASFDQERVILANVGIFLCLCGIAFNLALVILILGSKTLRNQYIYNQIVNIALADLGFVVIVDCFSVHNDLHQWTFGVGFCKAWMILDVALPTVSIVAILLLNADRVLFMYRTRLYEMFARRVVTRVFVLLYPWLISGVVVCSLWLGFSKVEPKPEFCMFGTTKEANTASTWLTVFLPAIFIVVLVVFVFIAALGDMPSEPTPLRHTNNHCSTNRSTIRREEFTLVQSSPERSGISVATSTTTTYTISDARQHRRIVGCILAVDFVSLLLSLPFTAFSHVSPSCDGLSSCQSMVTLFKTLSMMRSSVPCFRPILFIFLTRARFVCVSEDEFCCCQNRSSSSSSSSSYSYASTNSFSRARLLRRSIAQENTSSSHDNESQHIASAVEIQHSTFATTTTSTSIPSQDTVVSTSIKAQTQPFSPNPSTTTSGQNLTYSTIPSIPCHEGNKSNVTYI